MDITYAILIAIALVVVYLILRALSTVRIDPPQPGTFGQDDPERTRLDSPTPEPTGESSFEPDFEGTYRGVPYFVTSFDDIHLVVGVELDRPPAQRFEVTERIEQPDARMERYVNDVNALLNMGATHVDVGYNVHNWVAVEFPVERLGSAAAPIEKVLAHLVRLRDTATGDINPPASS